MHVGRKPQGVGCVGRTWWPVVVYRAKKAGAIPTHQHPTARQRSEACDKSRTRLGNAGFTMEERQKMTELLENGFTDSFRHFYPDKTGAYSWWSYMFHARDNNAGWRIDYFLVSNRLVPEMGDSLIYSDIMGSDHCPVGLEIFE